MPLKQPDCISANGKRPVFSLRFDQLHLARRPRAGIFGPNGSGKRNVLARLHGLASALTAAVSEARCASGDLPQNKNTDRSIFHGPERARIPRFVASSARQSSDGSEREGRPRALDAHARRGVAAFICARNPERWPSTAHPPRRPMAAEPTCFCSTNQTMRLGRSASLRTTSRPRSSISRHAARA